jgi:hypothetical protein
MTSLGPLLEGASGAMLSSFEFLHNQVLFFIVEYIWQYLLIHL